MTMFDFGTILLAVLFGACRAGHDPTNSRTVLSRVPSIELKVTTRASAPWELRSPAAAVMALIFPPSTPALSVTVLSQVELASAKPLSRTSRENRKVNREAIFIGVVYSRQTVNTALFD